MRRQYNLLGGSRGVSNVLGMVLVLGMIVTATMVIVTVGAVTFQQSQDQVTMESAVTAMEDLNERILEVASDPDTQSTISMPSMEEATLNVEESGWVNVSIENTSGVLIENRTTGEINLGKIVYERQDQTVAVQGGAVWRTNRGGNSVALVSEPSFQYRYGNGRPTISFPIVNLTGTTVASGELRLSQARPSERKLQQVNPIEPGQQLNISIKSEYAIGWANYFKTNTGGNVTRHGDRVDLILDGPKLNSSGGGPSGAVMAPYSGAYATNANFIDSYDSNNGTYSVSKNDEAIVVARDQFKPDSGATIKGDTTVGGEFGATNNNTFTGNVIVGGNVSDISEHVTFGSASNGTFSVRGNVEKAGGDVDFWGDVIVGGGIPTQSGQTFSARIYQDLHVGEESGGDFVLGNNGEVHGDIRVNGTAQFDAGTVHGAIDANEVIVGGSRPTLSGENITSAGPVTLETSGATVPGNVTAGGPITLEDGATIDGIVRTQDNVEVDGWDTEILDDIYASGDVNVRGGNKLTVDGNIYTEGNLVVESGDQLTVTGDVYVKSDVSVDGTLNINGDLYADGTVSWSGGSASGSVPAGTVSSGVPSSVDPEKPDPPLPVNIPTIDSHEDEIQQIKQQAMGSRPPAGPSSWNSIRTSTNGVYTVPGGTHYLDTILIQSTEVAKMDTTSEDIRLYVDSYARIKGKLKIIGDGTVEIYIDEGGHMGGDHFIVSKGAEVGNLTTKDATQLSVFMHPDTSASFKTKTHPKFVGLLSGPGNAANPGTEIEVTNNAEIWGAMIGHPGSINSKTKIHYDEALGDIATRRTTIARGPKQVKYVRLSVLNAAVN